MSESRNRHRYPQQGPISNQMIYPGNGYPPNPGEDRPGLSPFGRLAYGQMLGKSSLLKYNGNALGAQNAPVQMIGVEGDDLDASQLCITLASPRVVALAYADLPMDLQNVTGEQDNFQVSDANFPGTLAPVAWPPIEAVLEWGIKGASARAVVDYVNGTTINIVASYLRVFAQVSQSQADGGFAGTSAAYYLSAFVGPGTRTGNGTARRTVYVGPIVTGESSNVFNVPEFARRAIVLGCDTTVPPNITVASLSFWQSPDGTNNVGNYLQSGNQPIAFDIPAGAAYFSVYNQAGSNMLMSVIFELSI